jgi:hypothetical protein
MNSSKAYKDPTENNNKKKKRERRKENSVKI